MDYFIYIPLTIRLELDPSSDLFQGKQEAVKFMEDKTKKLLLFIGTDGSGKCTFLKRDLYVHLVECHCLKLSNYFPVLIEMRKAKFVDDSWLLAQKNYDNMFYHFKSNLIFLIDALDEALHWTLTLKSFEHANLLSLAEESLLLKT